MVCQRCRGLLVRETFDDLGLGTEALHTATRCLNCGCIEDAVIRTNRSRRLESRRAASRGRVRQGDSTYVKILSQAHASAG
ncbi:MAG: hypothetical protein OEU68_17600 [Nitrospira sp.]|jgi:RNase P subunit RPR2|nr:hypothetical protein [Nitrospira sp.]MDH4357485.1 hypothetical protein [Nitrospira sp.]MDH5319756.1 hypothetical protein [Nitrospira sp.]